MPSRSSFRPGHRGGRPDVDVIALAVPAEDRLLLGLGRSGGPTDRRCRAPDSSAPDVSAPGRSEARRSRRSPNRIKRLRHSSRIARTKAPRGRWHSARGRATRRGRGPCLARSAEHSHGVVSPTGFATPCSTADPRRGASAGRLSQLTRRRLRAPARRAARPEVAHHEPRRTTPGAIVYALTITPLSRRCNLTDSPDCTNVCRARSPDKIPLKVNQSARSAVVRRYDVLKGGNVPCHIA